MAAYVGRDGYVAVAGSTAAYIDSWTLNTSIGTADISSYSTSGARNYGQTLRDANVSITGTMDRSDAEQAALMDQFEDGTLADIDVRLYTQNANYWSGNARLTGMTVNSAVADKVSITWTAVINGVLSYT